MSAPRFFSGSRPLLTVLAMAGLSVFIAAPTPGDVGGCSSSAESVQVQPSDGGTYTAEFEYFDQGLCASFCETLRECGSLCGALVAPPGGAACSNDDPAAFGLCVRGLAGTLRADFFGGATSCPHACPMINNVPTHYTRAYGWDVQACGDAIASRTCSPATVVDGQVLDNGTLGSVLADPPLQCLNVCQ